MIAEIGASKTRQSKKSREQVSSIVCRHQVYQGSRILTNRFPIQLVDLNHHSASANMQEVLRNHVISKEIYEFCDLKTLKKLRLVSKEWNEKVTLVLQKRCREVTLTLDTHDDKLKRFESVLVNREISSELPLNVALSMDDRMTSTDWRWDCLVDSLWRFRVVRLNINICAEDRHLIKFLLQNLPALKDLKVRFHSSRLAEHSRRSIISGLQPDSVKFQCLESVEFSFELESGMPCPDVSFFRQCTSLKNFSISTWYVGVVVDLLKSWIQMHLEDSTLSRFRDIRLDFGENLQSKHAQAKVLDSIAEFIKLNQPTSLTVAGTFKYDFQILFEKIGCWTPGIHFFKTTNPVCSSLLRQFDVFADLTEINTMLSSFGKDIKEKQWLGSPEKHQLCKVASMSVQIDSYCADWTQKTSSALKQAAMELPNVTRLHLTGIPLTDTFALDKMKVHDYEGVHFAVNFDSFFEALKKFPGLRHLSMDLEAREMGKEFCFSKTHNKFRPEGHLKSLSLLEGLKTFTLFVNKIEKLTTKEMLLESLFRGYEPHVSLALDTNPRLLARRKNIFYYYKLQLSVEEFKEALAESHSVGAKWKGGRCNYKMCVCYLLDSTDNLK